MGQARNEEDEEQEQEEEEEEAVTARGAGPDRLSSARGLTAINLINVQQQFRRGVPACLSLWAAPRSSGGGPGLPTGPGAFWDVSFFISRPPSD